MITSCASNEKKTTCVNFSKLPSNAYKNLLTRRQIKIGRLSEIQKSVDYLRSKKDKLLDEISQLQQAGYDNASIIYEKRKKMRFIDDEIQQYKAEVRILNNDLKHLDDKLQNFPGERQKNMRWLA